jgi:hypothetical protein
MEDIINNIKIRLKDLGFNPEDFLEIKKISNIINNKQNNFNRWIYSLYRVLYEIGLNDKELDDLLNKLLDYGE